MRLKIAALIVLFSALPHAGISAASELHGVKFDPEYSSDSKQMDLKGMSLKRLFFLKIFTAGFYLETAAAPQDALSNTAKRVEATFFVHIPGAKLTKYVESMMQKNMTKEEYSLLDEQLKMMAEYFSDLNPGDRYALTYIPQVGTKFEHNGKFIGLIPGENFSRGIFSIWIGENPIDRNVKKQILGST